MPSEKMSFDSLFKGINRRFILIIRGRLIHNFGAAVQKDRSPSVERDLHDEMLRSSPSFDLR